MKTNYKKMLKFSALLTTSLLISFVSVQAYSEMFMRGTNITIGTAGVRFDPGDDTSTMGGADAINTQGTEVTFDQIPNIEPGEVRTYNEAVNITNNSGSDKIISISLYSLSGQWSSNFDYVNVTVIAYNGTAVGNTIKIVSSGSNVTSTGNILLPAGQEWAIRWVIKAKTTATNGQAITIVFKLEVN